MTASTRLGAASKRATGRGGAPATRAAISPPATQRTISFGRVRPSSVATRTPRTETGRSSSTAMAPEPMSSPTSAMSRAWMDTVAASEVMMYQVSVTALYPARSPPLLPTATRHSPDSTATMTR